MTTISTPQDDLSGAGPAAGVAGQLVLLAVLSGTVGLGPWGWLAGAASGVLACALLTGALRRSAHPLGPADLVTLGRTVLAGGVAAMVADELAGRPAPTVVLVALTGVALALDAVDGQVARRTGTASALGARFDMEVDAALIAVLSVLVSTALGGWVLAIGLLRYAFVLAGRALPWLRAALPVSMARKAVAAFQGIALAVAAAGVLPVPAAGVLVGLALALLVASFGRDVGWLWSHRGPAPDRYESTEDSRVGDLTG